MEAFTITKEDIESFEFINEESKVYDLTVENNSNFYLNTNTKNILVHNSAKSFTAALALCDGAANYNHRILYTRYTLTSAKDSIIPDFNEKISLLEYEPYFNVTNDRITGKHNNSKIVFKGFKTSSGNQTASLKSLKDFSILVCEELEEYPDFDEWDKVQLSIRATDVQCLNILIMNPTTKKHWSYDEFFRSKGVKPGTNAIIGNVCYIHTTYLDVDEKHIAPKNLRKYKEAKEVYDRLQAMDSEELLKQSKADIKKWKYYKGVVLGGWLEQAEGLVYENWDIFDEFPEDYNLKIFGLDFGFSTDCAAFIECVIKGNDVYLKEHIYKTGLLNRDLAALIKEILPKDEQCYIVADSASPKDITDLQVTYQLAVMPCVKGQGSVESTVKIMQSKSLHIHRGSNNIMDELNEYHTIELYNTKGEKKIHIVDADNHACDAFRYACTRYSI